MPTASCTETCTPRTSSSISSRAPPVSVDPSPFDRRRDIDPERMARDFIIAAESHGSDWARDLLAGYVRTSWLLTDEVYPGYTDALIGVLGGRLASASRSAGPVLSSTLLTECLGDAIRVMPDGVRLHALPGPMPVEQLARLIGGLIVSGISCRPL